MTTPRWVKHRTTKLRRWMKRPARVVLGSVKPGDFDPAAMGRMTQIVADPRWTLIQ